MSPNLRAILQPSEITPSGSKKDSDALKQVTEKLIGCAIEVHRQLGPGLTD